MTERGTRSTTEFQTDIVARPGPDGDMVVGRVNSNPMAVNEVIWLRADEVDQLVEAIEEARDGC